MPSKSSAKKKNKPDSEPNERRSKPKRSGRRKPPGPVMGLDLSMGGCGVCVLSGNKVLHLDRLMTAPVGSNGRRGLLASGAFLGSDEERIDFITSKLRKLWRKHKVCFIVIEGHAFGAKGRALTILHELHGVTKNKIFKDDVAWVPIPPTEVKKFATGSGASDKQAMILAANKAGLTDVKDSDRADAWWCARFAWDRFSDLTEK